MSHRHHPLHPGPHIHGTRPHEVERRAEEAIPVAEYFHGKKRHFDAKNNVHVVKIFAGDCYVSTPAQGNEMLTTILGSCVSACVRDPVARIGGMNHFLLPGDEKNPNHISDAARYGVFAMENLINGILKVGGHKDRLEFKVFGGGNVIKSSQRIGSKNAHFIRAFLQKEGFRITTENMEGDHPRRVHYFPDTGKVMMLKLRRQEDMAVVKEEALYNKQIISKPTEGSIELF